jgi:hypothetical protein
MANLLASVPFRSPERLQGRCDSIRPLPKHSLQRGGNIFRFGCNGCSTFSKPVPPHAWHFVSVTTFGLGLVIFILSNKEQISL